MAVAASSFPVQVLLGVYLGILTGIIPALVVWGLAVLFRYVAGVTVPAFGVVVLGVAIAGVNGGFLALVDPSIQQSTNSVALVTAVIVVMMVSFYAHSQGDKLGASLPRHLSWRTLRERTLSSDVVELVGGRGQVRVDVVGDVADMEGYPALPPDIRADIRSRTWTLPADLPLSELEGRFADRLRTEYDLADVTVTLDERARATVTAAPPLSGLSRRVPEGKRAVSVDTLVPTGVARGDEVTVSTGSTAVAGTVVSARTGAAESPTDQTTVDAESPEEDAPGVPPQAEAPTTGGGEGRVTLAVGREEATALLSADGGQLVVTARGTRREFELVSLLRRGGKRIRRVGVREGGLLDGTTIGEADVRDAHDVAIIAVRHGGRWAFAPRGDAELAGGDELFVVGTPAALDRFETVGAVQ